MKLYRLLLHAYPRTFRREYGDDMVALVQTQLREERAARVVGRTVLDLALTIPTRHLETHMNASSGTALIVILVAVGGLLAVLGNPIGVVAALVLFALAGLAWRRNRPVVEAGDGRWWKLLLSGVGLLGTLVVVTTITGELPSGWWEVAMLTILVSFGLMGTGIVLGIAGRIGTRAA